MSLVNYGSSDDESSDSNLVDDGISTKSSNEDQFAKNQIQNDSIPNKTSLLPSIKTLKPKNSDNNRIKIEAFNQELIANQELSDSDSDDEASARKRFKKSEKGSSLISMLPQPKNQPSKKSSTLLIPNSISSRSRTKSTTTKTTAENGGKNFFFAADSGDDDDDDDDDDKYLSSNNHIHPPNNNDDGGLTYGPSRPPESLPQASSSKEDPNNDYTFKKFIASKFDDHANNIKIIDVDLSKHLSENKDWLKNISLEKDIKDEDIKTKAPNSLAKRKNQITFLAFQAQKRELELKNQWAQNKQAKNQSKAKYGF